MFNSLFSHPPHMRVSCPSAFLSACSLTLVLLRMSSRSKKNSSSSSIYWGRMCATSFISTITSLRIDRKSPFSSRMSMELRLWKLTCPDHVWLISFTDLASITISTMSSFLSQTFAQLMGQHTHLRALEVWRSI